MNTIAFVFIFFFGIIIGSFLNVIIYRFNTGRTFVNAKDRSICMTCNNTLRWYELIPVFSFLIQSGKCRRCEERISHQYPLVELGTGVLFVLVAYHFLPVIALSFGTYVFLLALYAFIFSILVVISVYDMRHKIIPDKLAYIYAFAAIISIFVNHTGMGTFFVVPTISQILAGPILAAPFALLWLLSRGKWMGLGDAKLMLGIGWMLGIYLGFSAMILSFWIGSVLSLLIMFFSKKRISMKTEIPFAPFLIISTLIVFLFNLDIFSLSSLFQF